MSELTNMEDIFVITNKKKYLEKNLDIWIFLLIFKYRNKSYARIRKTKTYRLNV